MNFLNIYSTAKFITLNLKSTFPLAPFLIFHAPTSEERMWPFAEGHKPGAEQHPFLESFPLGPEWDTSAVRSRVHRAMGFSMATTVDWGQLPGWSWGRVLNWGFQLLTKHWEENAQGSPSRLAELGNSAISKYGLFQPEVHCKGKLSCASPRNSEPLFSLKVRFFTRPFFFFLNQREHL